MDPELARITALQLLEDAARSSAGTAAELVDKSLSADYWRGLNPQLTIEGGSSGDLESAPLDEPEREATVAHIAERGYFHTGPVLAPEFLSGLSQAVETTRAAGWPATACFVYDEFWHVSRTRSTQALLRRALGHGCAQIPKFWGHYVNPLKHARGWRPHIDGGLDAAREQRLTVWVPLTEATLDNGCMYVIPRDLEPPEGVDQADVRAVLPAVRAVPAHPGELVGWDHHTLHWGSTVSENDARPRISLSFEFISADATPSPDEQPLLDLEVLPSFEQRLGFIANGVAVYVKFESELALHREVFREVRERLHA